jgi:hypothetical protein
MRRHPSTGPYRNEPGWRTLSTTPVLSSLELRRTSPVLAIRRLLVGAAFAAVAGCTSSAPTPIPAFPVSSPAATASAAATIAPPSPSPSLVPTPAPSVAPVLGFTFPVEEVVAYYRESGGFACDDWSPADPPGYQVRSCQRADAANPVADQSLTVTVDAAHGLADIVAVYEHRDGSSVDRAGAMRFFATVIGASFGGVDGQDAAVWLGQHLGADRARVELRGLTLDTFLAAIAEHRGSQLFLEIATPGFAAGA